MTILECGDELRRKMGERSAWLLPLATFMVSA